MNGKGIIIGFVYFSVHVHNSKTIQLPHIFTKDGAYLVSVLLNHGLHLDPVNKFTRKFSRSIEPVIQNVTSP